MNLTDYDSLLIIIVLLLFLILVIVIASLVFGIFCFKNQKINESLSSPSSIQIESDNLQGTGVCQLHSEIESTGLCSICDQEFCSKCLKSVDKLTLCPEHFTSFFNFEWTPITNQMTTPDNPEAGVYIYDFKRKIWNDTSVPSYIVTNYKIHVENDHIESYVQLFVRSEDAESLSFMIKEFNDD